MAKRFLTLVIVFLFASCGSNHIVKEVKKLDYPSASAIEYFNKQFFIIGDDANSMLILDSNLNSIDSIPLFEFKERRIPKAVKPDLESIILVRDAGKTNLVLFGSGSLAPYRNIAFFIDPLTKQTDSIRMDVFYNRILVNGIKEVNIEGSCTLPGYILFTNRGSKGYPTNWLIFTSSTFWQNQSMAPLTAVRMGTNNDTLVFNGISGMGYAPKGDRLIMTISTEDTRNALDDGAIGKSYLWIVKNISSKRNWKAINPDQVIDLDELDPRFKGQKIESVCVTKETNKNLHLVLAADNDDGSSTLFKIVVEKE